MNSPRLSEEHTGTHHKQFCLKRQLDTPATVATRVVHRTQVPTNTSLFQENNCDVMYALFIGLQEK